MVEQILWTEKQQMISYMISLRLFYIISHILISELCKHDLHKSTYYEMGVKQAGEHHSEWYQGFTAKVSVLCKAP